jgi:protein-tyrosine phosphatase
VLIRAGNLDQIPASSQQQLMAMGVKTIIDLRDEWEVEHYPNVFAQSQNVNYVNLPLIGNHLSNSEAWQQETLHYASLHELYCIYLDRCQAQVGAIISTIAESTPTIVFQCYAGKDRTGIIAALLLGVVGVPDHLIAEDYSHSKAQIGHLIEQWRAYALQQGRDMQRLALDAGSEATTILEMLAHIRRQYGTVADYLRACGVTDRQLAQLRSRFIESE